MYNNFIIKYVDSIFQLALDSGYEFLNLENFYDLKKPLKKFVLRLDVEFQPQSLESFLELTSKYKIPMTIYVRVSGPYNVLWYNTYKYLKKAQDQGH